MIKEAIEKIESMATPHVFDIEDAKYTNKTIYPVLNPIQDEVAMSTLTGLVDYIKSPDVQSPPTETIIHVVSPGCVKVMSIAEGEFKQRTYYAEAVCRTPRIRFRDRLTVEEFVIQLQSMFEQTEYSKNLLKFVGSLKAGYSKTMKDDGVSQMVETKTGAATIAEVSVPNPVRLQPYRTFSEIWQPESSFVFRIHAGDKVTCALYEADGGAWESVAMLGIASWLMEKLPEHTVIA